MKTRIVELTTDTFALLWAARQSDEYSEDDIIVRLLTGATSADLPAVDLLMEAAVDDVKRKEDPVTLPASVRWTDVLTWTLERLGGDGTLAEIYQMSREGRRLLGRRPTREHDASARECLESHCSDSQKWRRKADLFWMPNGKGAGVWALR